MANFKNTTINDTGYIKIATGTTAERPATASAGMIRWNSSLSYAEVYTGTEWKKIEPGFTGLYYSEGLTAPTDKWDNKTTYTMADFGGLGSATAHGFSSGPATFNFTITGLPPHSTLRYVVNWHMVDSLDNETSYLDLTDNAGTYQRFFTWTKVYSAAPSFSFIKTGATQTWSGAKTYSYRPWANGTYGADGYSTLDSGYFSHTQSTFSARHYMGADQAQADEAMYLTNVAVWLTA